jgi:acylphosphatase
MNEEAGEPAGRARGVRWLVSGRVQGVGFRYHVWRAALQYGVQGDVRNLRDGRVEVRAAGATGDLERLLGEIRCGPAGARVDQVESLELEPTMRFTGFEIRY